MYNNAQKTAGYVSDDLLAWAANQAKEAKAKGNLVLAMSHHGLLPHYDTDLEDQAAWYMDSFRVPNWEKVADTLADAGVSAVLTGHTHANDIATHVSKNNNVLYDVETAALCAYPCLWREFDIVTAGFPSTPHISTIFWKRTPAAGVSRSAAGSRHLMRTTTVICRITPMRRAV